MAKKQLKRKPTSKGKELTPKEKLFCKNYLINGFNASQAALTAGYSKKYYGVISDQLMHKPRIRQYLKKRMAEAEKKLDITFEKKLKLLWKCAKRCYGITDDELERLKNGEEIKARFNFLPDSLISTIAEMNKMQGHYAQAKPVDSNDNQEGLGEIIKQYEREC